MLSILIPTYNYSVVLLVKTLHQQALREKMSFEIIVFDDASSLFLDENDQLNSLQHVSFVKHPNNKGRTAMRTLLAKQAYYNWLLFLDADVKIPSNHFLSNYIKSIKDDLHVVFGGVDYTEEEPEKRLSLRWHYGKAREAKTVAQRKQSPYFIISQNLLIQKKTFLKANVITKNYYGLDNLFSNQLYRMKAKVLHIDNPVIHLGLEENTLFIKKALKAVETTVIFEEKGLMDFNLRPLQKAYRKLKTVGMTGLFSFFISQLKRKMEKNFQSGVPNLFWFDLYRLYHYIELKKKNRG